MNGWQTIVQMENWEVAQYSAGAPDNTALTEDLDWIKAKVPGAIQYDLMAAGKLENPYASTKAAFDAAWVAKSDWLYRASFYVENPRRQGRWILKVNGVDTYGEIWLNGSMLGEVQNNYRKYEFPVDAGVLKQGENLLRIRVKAHDRMMKGVEKAKKRLGRTDGVEGLLGKSLIRRYQRSFFSGSSLLNLGTGVLGIGINRPVELCFYAESRVTDCYFRTIGIGDGAATGEIHITADGPDQEVSATITNPDTGETVLSLCGKTADGKLVLPVKLENPRLWWPAGYGEANLYELEVSLKSGDVCLHRMKQTIGVKTVELVTKLDSGRNTFYFKINGKKIYVRGQNLIPIDYIKVYGEPEEYARLFRLLTGAHTNLIRIWGGGMPESAEFFDECSRRGILIWQECFLHSNVYPDYDTEFVEEFMAESEQIIRDARTHVCLAIVCGGNEQCEGWDEWGWKEELDSFYGEKLICGLLPPLSAGLCPEIPYITNSPHGGKYAQSPVEGECHNWGSFYNCMKDPLFVTETCWSQESYSRPETLQKYMGINVDDYSERGWLEKFSELTSRPVQNRLPYSNWFDVSCLKNYLLSLDIEQARADYNALGIFRLRSPSNNGVVYWPFNKGGPLFQFGCVDYGGYPMISYYVLCRLFDKCVAGVYRDANDINVMVSNQSGGAINGTIELLHMRADGGVIHREEQPVRLEDGGLARVLSLPDAYSRVVDRTREVCCARLVDEAGAILSEDVLYFCPFSEFEQAEASIKARLTATEDGCRELTIESGSFLQMVAIECNHKILCSDNYFHLSLGTAKTVRLEILEATSDDPLELEVRALSGARCVQTLRLK